MLMNQGLKQMLLQQELMNKRHMLLEQMLFEQI
jgi:hypothetical protein